jgi:hypothetical protein
MPFTRHVPFVKSGAIWAPTSASVPLRAWYRMDLGISVSGGVVDSLADQSGAGDTNRNQSASGAARPSYSATNGLYNNRPTITGDTSKMLSSAGAWSTAPFTAPFSLVIVGHAASLSAFVADGGSNMVWADAAGSGKAEYYVSGNRLTATSLVTSASGTLITDDGTGGASAAKIYVNSFGTPQTTRTTIADASGTVMDLMRSHSGVSQLDGTLAEVILWSGILTPTDASNLVTYLNGLYALGFT